MAFSHTGARNTRYENHLIKRDKLGGEYRFLYSPPGRTLEFLLVRILGKLRGFITINANYVLGHNFMIHYTVKFAAATGVIVWSCTTLLLFK